MYNLLIKSSPGKGKGVFAAKNFSAGEIIEVCPVIPLAGKYMDAIDTTPLTNYYFLWGEDSSDLAICLGYGSLHNHADIPNTKFIKNYRDDTITFVCLSPIVNGEEITISYVQGHPGEKASFDSEGNRTIVS